MAAITTAKKKLVAALSARLGPRGFTWRSSRMQFERDFGDGLGVQALLVPVRPYRGRAAVSPEIGIRFHEVERWYHLVSGTEPKDQDKTFTLGASFEELFALAPIVLNSTDADDIDAAALQIDECLTRRCLPLIDPLTSLAAIDRTINAAPDQGTVWRTAWDRSFSGVTIAFLLMRSDREALASRYRAVLAELHDGYYLPAFDKLVVALRARTIS